MTRRRSPDAIEAAQHSDRPTLIAAKTTIGFGAPTKAGTNKAHGSPLGAEEIAGARKALRLGLSALRDAVRHPRRLARGRPALGRQARTTGKSAWPAPTPSCAPSSSGACSGELPAGFRRGDRRLQEEARRRQAEGRDPQIVRDGARGDQRRGARDHRRLGRPDRLEQHQDQPDQGRSRPATTATATSTTASASTAWRRR